jgi:hypothetical protein
MAEDIAHDALTGLVRRWRNHGPPDSPEAFAFAIAKRRANQYACASSNNLLFFLLICGIHTFAKRVMES